MASALAWSCPAQDALTRLYEAVEAAAVGEADAGAGPRRIAVAVDAGPPLGWWGAAPARLPAVYFAGRDGEDAVLGLGVAALATAREAAAGAPGARWFGGLAFGDRGDEARFAAPIVEIGRDGARAWVAATLSGPPELARRRALGLIARLAAAGPEAPGRTRYNALRARWERPGRAAWEEGVAQALAAIAAGAVDKVVLARQVELALVRPLDAAELVARLGVAEPRSCRFALRADGTTYVGASPERLYARRGRTVLGEAVAGTRRRGGDAQAAAAELLGSDKDQREHALVVAAVRGALESVCTAVSNDDVPRIMELRNLVHLHTRARGTLAPGRDDGDLIAALHPTPAVCGWPRDEARRLLGGLEGFGRGRYAAPIGWIGAEGAELAVGIRAVELAGRVARLTVGAGIVRGSDPGEEWLETEGKLAGVLAALGVEA